MKKGTLLLVSANLAAYALLSKLSGGVVKIDRYYIDLFGLSKEVLFPQQYYWQPLTSFFLHFNLPHLGYNMLFLAVFGHFAENIYGWRRLFVIYLLSGFFVSLAAILFYPNAVFGGASGAVLGLVGAVLAQQKNRHPTAILALAIFLFVAVSQVYIAHFTGLLSGFVISKALTRQNNIQIAS